MRVFALNWIFGGAISAATTISFASRLRPVEFYTMATPLSLIAAGAILWIVSPGLARLAAKGSNSDASLRGISEQALLTTAFVTLGLYFALKSFPTAASWLHYLIVSSPSETGGKSAADESFYPLTENLLTVGVGIGLVMTAKLWATKLSRKKPIVVTPLPKDDSPVMPSE